MGASAPHSTDIVLASRLFTIHMTWYVSNSYEQQLTSLLNQISSRTPKSESRNPASNLKPAPLLYRHSHVISPHSDWLVLLNFESNLYPDPFLCLPFLITRNEWRRKVAESSQASAMCSSISNTRRLTSDLSVTHHDNMPLQPRTRGEHHLPWTPEPTKLSVGSNPHFSAANRSVSSKGN